MTNEIDITNLQSGEETAFRNLFNEYNARLCYFAQRLLPNSVVAEDVVQEAFLIFWQKRRDFDHPKAIKHFLYLTVRNHCFNIYKHQKVVQKHEDQLRTLQEEGIDNLIEAEVLAKVMQALNALPPGCRTVVQLSYFNKMKNQEIANHLDVSINTVKTQKKRAIHLLRKTLKTATIRLFMLCTFLP